jgi:hypothetical protein
MPKWETEICDGSTDRLKRIKELKGWTDDQIADYAISLTWLTLEKQKMLDARKAERNAYFAQRNS